jgi:hypothetical protein
LDRRLGVTFLVHFEVWSIRESARFAVSIEQIKVFKMNSYGRYSEFDNGPQRECLGETKSAFSGHDGYQK